MTFVCRFVERPACPWAGAKLRFPAVATVLRFAGVISPTARRFNHVLSLLAQPDSGVKETATPHQVCTPQGNPKPHSVHTKLHFYPFQNGRLIIIGDVHGCAVELAQLLQKVKYDRGRDKLVFVGDLVNKGPNSLQVLRLAMTLGAAAVRGNHDDQALSAYRTLQTSAEGLAPQLRWVKGMRPQEAAFLRDLPFTISVPSHRLLIVHAGFVPRRPKHKQNFLDMYLMREVTPDAADGYNACRPAQGEAWASKWDGPEHIIFGHDAGRRLQKYPSCTGIDTGCVYGGSLTACIMPIVLPEALDKNMTGAPTLEMLHAKLLHVPAAKTYVKVA